MNIRSILLIAPVLLLAPAALAQQAPIRTPSGSILRTFVTPYYILHTDLGEADAREADLRMTRMFEEYKNRTSGFAGQVKDKFPFFLFRNASDYYAAGVPKGSAGVYMEGPDGSKLMAIAGERTSAMTWHVVQHEGFHQFVSATIHNDIPIWVNEGLAEYFGEGLWTGDNFVTGLAPLSRVQEIKDAIRGRKFKPFKTMMTMSAEEWGSHLEYANYDEAWAMVHFLAHADNGKYQQPFLQFMSQISKGGEASATWNKIFGNDTIAFENRFMNWWLSLPDEPTRTGYLQALVQTETSYFARAYMLRQSFPDLPTFFKSYKPPNITVTRDFWLPPALFQETSEKAARVGDWSLVTTPGQPPHIILTDGDGTKYTSSFVINNNKVARVTVNITPGTTSNARIAPGR